MSDTSQGPGWWQASDGKFYPPQSAAPQVPAAPVAKKGGLGKKLLIGSCGFFALAVAISAAGGGTSPEETALNAASSEVATATEAPAAEATPAPTLAEAPAEAPKPAPTTTPPTAPPTTPPPTAPPTTPKPTTTEAPKPQFSVSQTNAVRKAKSYLSHTAFSRQGLIEQLEYEGFSNADSTFGTDAQNADWNEQAAKKGASYLSHTSFSRQGLVEQLEYEGFTREQAEYGAGKNGL